MIYPKKPSGRLHNYRILTAIILLASFYFFPFIQVKGQPIILLNILTRKFYIFGVPFVPQDFHLFVLAMIAAIVFLLLFTVLYGRLFCGWVCPQTLFLEMLFRKIEYLIEGNAHQQRRRDKSSLNFNKFVRKFFKHLIFIALAYITGNIMLAYIIGMETLLEIVADPPSQHVTGLTAMIVFSGVFYFIFAFFREQVCTLVCPYGRLQGVLLDSNSIVVSYDFVRGEPKGKLAREGIRPGNGDCIDCGECVKVCPTGIDIRNGTQLECINCTACIDSCNHVMKKIHLPSGLIRYASHNGIVKGDQKLLTLRTIAYSAVLLLLIGLTSVLFLTRQEVEVTILRQPGTICQQLPNGRISNLYHLKAVNKTSGDLPIRIRLLHPKGEIRIAENVIDVPAHEIIEAAFFIIINRDELTMVNTSVQLEIISDEKALTIIKTSFTSLDPNLKTRELQVGEIKN